MSGVVDAPHHATIAGEEGGIEFAPPFVFPTAVGIAAKGVDPPMQWWVDESHIRRHAGWAYQATAFADYVGRGLIESPLQSYDDSLACLRVATEITRRLGADPPRRFVVPAPSSGRLCDGGRVNVLGRATRRDRD